MEFDFGYNGEGNAPDGSSPNGNASGEDITNISTGGVEHDPNGVPADDITGEGNDNNDDNNWLEEIHFKEAIKDLSEREKNILALRFMQGKTQMEVSREIGISQAQVSRLEKGALDKIKS